MKKIRYLSLFLSLVLVLTSLSVPVEVSAAGKKITQSITLNVKSKQTMYVGMSKKVKVTSVTPKGSSKKVTYKSSDSSVAKVSKSGTIKALKPGTATITVTSASNSDVSKKVKVTVKNLVKNKTYNKMVIALDKKKKTKKLSFASKVKASNLSLSSSKKKVAEVSGKGVVTGKKVGKAKITIKGKKSSVKGAKQVLTVYVAKKSVKTVALNLETVTLNPKETAKLKTTVTPKKAANVVVYESSDEGVAKVTQSGKVTAVAPGTATITAITVDGNKKATCTVTVNGDSSSNNQDQKPGDADVSQNTVVSGNTSGDTDADKPGDADTDKPGDTDTDKPSDTETDKPGDTDTDKPGDTETDQPGDTETDQPGDTDTDQPGDTETDKPSDTDTDKPSDTETDQPGDTETDQPGDTETDQPGDTETDQPGDTETDQPGDTETDQPGDTETDQPGDTETDQPGDTETDQPGDTETDQPGDTETDKPSDTDTDKPSDTDNDQPSDTETEITYTDPVTIEELESKFPEEPEYPALELQDNATMEVSLKDDLLTLDVEAGTMVKTKGYYAENDGGQAVYEIMTYDDWWNQLPLELKMVTYHVDRVGAGQVLYKNPADNYGNHRLDNGMVAKLLPNEDGYVRVEQWGLFPGRTDNNRALIHIFANNHTNSKILFAKDATYELYYDSKNQAYQNQNGVVEEVPWWLNVDNIGNNGNEYALSLHCRATSKPVIGDAKNVELCGNGATIHIPDGEFCKGNTADFAMFETGGYVDGLTIHGFTFDNNGLNQHSYVNADGESAAMRTTNHTISYFSSGLNVAKDSVLKDGNGVAVLGETTFGDLCNYTGETKTTFNNVEIYGNTFLANGTSQSISDGGGDDILVINPDASENVNIHNNKMYNWGRWAFAVDLGGNGERFYNYTFKQNICIQDETNVCAYPLNNYPLEGGSLGRTTSLRGLGWIDFEARKCFTNLDVSENYVYGANGWAFNGNGKISENITINANVLERASYEGYSWRSIYPYVFTFYSVYPKNMQVTNNKIGSGSIGFGNSAYNLRIENNDLGSGSFSITRPLGEVIIRNNTSVGVRNQSYSINAPADLPWIDDETSEFYVAPEDRETNILFEGNSTGGVVANIIVPEDGDDYRKNMTLTFKNNSFMKFNVNAIGLKDFYFTPDQLATSDLAWAARGCLHASTVVPRHVDNPVPGGLYYHEGDVIADSLDQITRLYNPYYFTTLFPQLKNDNGTIKKDMKMVCTKEGVFPINGEFLNADADAYFTAEKEYSVGTFIYTADNLYYVTVAGTSGTEEPTHTSGTVTNGTAELRWIAPIARYEMQEKTVVSENSLQ